jgi:hypothetical protein
MGAEEVPSSAFLCRSGRFAEASSRVVGTGEVFLVPLVFRSPQHFIPRNSNFFLCLRKFDF